MLSIARPSGESFARAAPCTRGSARATDSQRREAPSPQSTLRARYSRASSWSRLRVARPCWFGRPKPTLPDGTRPMDATVVLLPGDGVGPEVVEQTRLVLEAVAKRFGHRFSFQTCLMGGAAIDATGEALPQATLDACKASHAVL